MSGTTPPQNGARSKVTLTPQSSGRKVYDRACKSSAAQVTGKSDLKHITDNLIRQLHDVELSTSSRAVEPESVDRHVTRLPIPFDMRIMEDMLKRQSDELLHKFEAKINHQAEALKTHFDQALEAKFKSVMDYVDGEIGRVCERIDGIENKLTEVVSIQSKAAEFDPENTIVAENMPFEADENLMQKVTDMIRRDLAINVPIVNVMRLKEGPPRHTRYGTVLKPGLVKIQMKSVDDKVAVLREKKNITNSREFSQVFIHGSKTHGERMMEHNFKTILDLIPGADDYMMTGNGRLVKRRDQAMSNNPRNNAQPSSNQRP